MGGSLHADSWLKNAGDVALTYRNDGSIHCGIFIDTLLSDFQHSAEQLLTSVSQLLGNLDQVVEASSYSEEGITAITGQLTDMLTTSNTVVEQITGRGRQLAAY